MQAHKPYIYIQHLQHLLHIQRLQRPTTNISFVVSVVSVVSVSLGYGDQSDVGEMTQALTPLRGMAHAHNCAVLLVDHHRKTSLADPDAVSDLLGSTAKAAIADSVWGVYRERGKAGAKLAVTGRDIEERTLALTWDRLTGCWQCEGDADELALTERRQEIVEALAEMGARR